MMRDRYSDIPTRSFHYLQRNNEHIETDAIILLLVFLAGIACGMLFERRK